MSELNNKINELRTLKKSYSDLADKVENQLPAIADKIDNIKLPEIDTTEIAKESTLQGVLDKLDNLNVEVNLSEVAKESTLNSVSEKLDNLNVEVDLSSVAKEDTLSQGVVDIRSAVENIDLTLVETKVDAGVAEIKNKLDNINLSAIEGKIQEESAAIQSKIDNIDLSSVAKQGDNQEATNSKILEELDKVKETFDSLGIPISAISSLALELEGGKKNIANALKARGVESSVNTDTLTDMAAKVYEVKNPVAFTVPAETSNEWADVMFNTIMKSQGYDKMYAEVVKTYCGEGGTYVGCLMTALRRLTNVSINLTGADAYYIYEENIFYRAGTGGKLIQILNGIETQLTTTAHVWNTDFQQNARTVFYLYLPNSTANGVRENVHYSVLDYCYDTTIPVINIQNRGGNFVHLHVNNVDTCAIYQTSSDHTRMVYFYSNLRKLFFNQTLLRDQSFVYLPYLEEVEKSAANSFNLIETQHIDSICLPNIKVSKEKVLLAGRFSKVELPQLKTNEGGILSITSPIRRLDIYLPSLEYTNTPNSCGINDNNYYVGEMYLYIKSGAKINSLMRSNNIEKLYVTCDEMYHEGNFAYPMFCANEVYFQGLKKGNLYLGSSASYECNIKYMYINCIGSREDEINIEHRGREYNTSIRDHCIEISEGTRQPLSILEFIYMSADNIVNRIFKKLADNRFEDDGVTPAPAIKIAIGATCLAKLTDEQKAIATDKNYILA